MLLSRLKDGEAEPEYPNTEQDRYKQLYYEAIDLASSQPKFKVYAAVQNLLLKAAKKLKPIQSCLNGFE